MRVGKNDYVVVAIEGTNKHVGGKVSAVDGKLVRFVSLITPHINKQVVECKASNIVVNLGADPSPGKVYGVDFTHVHHGKTIVPKIDLRLDWFYRPEKEERSSVERAFRIVYKKLANHGLRFLLNNDNTVWEVQGSRSGKYSGMYLHPRDPVTPGRLQICPMKANAPDYPYIIAHELGHRLHLRYAPESGLNSKWLHVFNTSIKLVNVDKAMSKTMLERLLSGDVLPSKFASELSEDDEKLSYKMLIRFISQSRSLTVYDLDDLFKADARDELKSVWPTRTIPKKELEPVVTEYACKNVKELVAESFAYHIIGKKLPKQITKLVEKTISIGKQNHRNPE